MKRCAKCGWLNTAVTDLLTCGQCSKPLPEGTVGLVPVAPRYLGDGNLLTKPVTPSDEL